MNRNFKFFAMFLSMALVGMSQLTAQVGKIATVDMQQLFKEYHMTTEEQEKFNVEFARIQKENNERLTGIRDLEESLRTLKKEVEDPSLADNVRQQKRQEFEGKLDDAKALDRERREYLNRRTRALELKKSASMRGLLEEIRKHIEDYAKGEDFDYVFDKSGLSSNQVPFLLYTKDATDITAQLITTLNKDAPADSAPAAE
ncbi:OmpH family outer membrane protein [Persicirhabdus sediminis]|uniref:OmpH family outer membrane protein n=1 Tax=Persicirhabdus sediminis TaxID=454144 RepID=A0A8J7MDN9_9BACT|nr:OmpH family outer membrane protein [Persicirhabdus sediminis]MBK1791919.1 OmpH family outer membrane protein [Persicirhabdus sediminis]